MSSIDSSWIIQTILKNGGQYPGDPPCTGVYQYRNQGGGITYKLCYNENQENIFLKTGIFTEVVQLWGEGKLTPAGQCFLDEKAEGTEQ